MDNDLIWVVLEKIAERIELCGASPELTDAVSLTTDLSLAIGNKFNPPSKYALERVMEAIK